LHAVLGSRTCACVGLARAHAFTTLLLPTLPAGRTTRLPLHRTRDGGTGGRSHTFQFPHGLHVYGYLRSPPAHLVPLPLWLFACICCTTPTHTFVVVPVCGSGPAYYSSLVLRASSFVVLPTVLFYSCTAWHNATPPMPHSVWPKKTRWREEKKRFAHTRAEQAGTGFVRTTRHFFRRRHLPHTTPFLPFHNRGRGL